MEDISKHHTMTGLASINWNGFTLSLSTNCVRENAVLTGLCGKFRVFVYLSSYDTKLAALKNSLEANDVISFPLVNYIDPCRRLSQSDYNICFSILVELFL